MNGDFRIGGVIVTPVVPELLVAVALTACMSFVLLRLNLFRFVWHRPLVELSILCIIFALLDGW